MIIINLDEVLKDHKSEPIKVINLVTAIPEFFNNCKDNLSVFKDQYESIRNKIQKTIKEDLKPFIFIDHLEQLLNQSFNKEFDNVTKKDLIRFALSIEAPKDLIESKILGNILYQVNNSLELVLKKDNEKTLLCEKLLKLKGIQIDVLNLFIYEIQETIES